MSWLPSPQMNQPSLINGNYSCSDGRSLSAGKLTLYPPMSTPMDGESYFDRKKKYRMRKMSNDKNIEK